MNCVREFSCVCHTCDTHARVQIGAEQLKITQNNMTAMEEEVVLKSKALEDSNKELEATRQAELDLKVSSAFHLRPQPSPRFVCAPFLALNIQRASSVRMYIFDVSKGDT